MKTLEYHYGGDWRDKILNAFAMDVDRIRTVVLAWDAQGIYRPEARSLYYNGYAMARLNWPLGVFLHLKPLRNLRIQLGIGWKLNGRFALIARAQSDKSAAVGVHGPNIGQAIEWDRGTA